jgi:hypothetical protein
MKRREELLSHLTAVFEEEAARLGDQSRALARTEERFGSAAELTEQLQSSVPSNDRVTEFLEGVIQVNHVFSWRHAVGNAFLALPPALASFVAIASLGRMSEWPIVVGMVAFAFTWLMLMAAVRDALFGPRGRRWPRAAVLIAVSWVLVPGFTFALCLTFTRDWRSSLADAAQLLPMGLMAPALMFCWACALAVDLRTRLEWESLRID